MTLPVLIADAVVKLVRTLLGIPGALLAVALSSGTAGREGAACKLGSKARNMVWSGMIRRVSFALWAGVGICANRVGRGCRSKLVWVLLGQHWFGRGLRKVHCTWGQTGTFVSCVETLPSVSEGFNRTVSAFLGL